ncbi:hypothetical protein ES703_28427 [subsurface metagenome]
MARDLKARMFLVAVATVASEVETKEIAMENWQFWMLFGVLVLIYSFLLWGRRRR